MKIFAWILWPSFMSAAVAEAVFFSIVSPQELFLFGEPVHLSQTAIYSIGFFAFWFLTGLSSYITCVLQRSAEEINRCPLTPPARPEGCPKREEPGHGPVCA